MNLSDDYKQLHHQHEEALRFLAALVERGGGEILLLRSELVPDRQLSKTNLGGLTGAVRLTVKRI